LKGLLVLCDRKELPAKAIKKIASMVKTHARYVPFVGRPFAARKRLFFKAKRRAQ
jgi:hypothetical protein